MSKKIVIVSPAMPFTGLWQIKLSWSKRKYKTFPKPDEATEYARNIAKFHKCQLLTFKLDGSIRSIDTYDRKRTEWEKALGKYH